MIAVRHSRFSTLRLVNAALPLAAIAFSASLAACRDADTRDVSAQQSSAAALAGELQPPTEIAIARPTGRYEVDSAASGAPVAGTVTAPAALVAGPPAPTGRDSVPCGPAVPDESVVRQGNGLGGAVVWLDDIRRGKPLPIERRLELESDKCRLTPRVQAAVVGSAVNVIGHDDFRQRLRFMAGGEREPRASVLLARYEQVIPTERPFAAPGLVIVRDRDHAWPTAYLAVFDHPYFAVTAPNGTFTIDRVPPGRYRLKVWHERAKLAERVIDVGASGATVSVALEAK